MEHTHDIEKLANDIKMLEVELQKLAGMRDTGDTDWGELFKVIHRPGWTTLPEYILVSSILETMTAQARSLNTLKQNLLQASSRIGEKEKE